MYIKANFNLVKSMEKAYIHGQMKITMTANGLMIVLKEWEPLC